MPKSKSGTARRKCYNACKKKHPKSLFAELAPKWNKLSAESKKKYKGKFHLYVKAHGK